MDPLSIVVAGGAYFGLKDLVPRILGPTADYLGAGMRTRTQRRGQQTFAASFKMLEKRLVSV